MTGTAQLQEAAMTAWRGTVLPPTRAARRRAAVRAATVAAAGALLPPLLAAGPSVSAERPGPAALQQAFADAAARYRVPQRVLLGVSYLQSRWDDHHGAPSVSGGYGPMHLTDARTALAEAPRDAAGEDWRGDTARRPLSPHVELDRSAGLPARLRTLKRAARLTRIPANELRADPAANVRRG